MINMDFDRIKSLVKEINRKYETLSSLTNDELRKRYAQLRKDALEKEKSNISVNKIFASNLVEVFALFKEASRRFAENKEIKVEQTDLDVKLFDNCSFIKECQKNPNDSIDQSYLWSVNYVSSWVVGDEAFTWNIIPYDEQLMGGIALHEGKIIQMCTGEGKTFVSIAPVLLNALLGKSCHIMTANSYLSKRDYEITRPIYSFFGLTVSCIEGMEEHNNALREAYKADVVFGTTSHFIFDYLYDMMNNNIDKRVQGSHSFAILDEADSVLVDDAATPHIISSFGRKNNDVMQANELFSRYLPIVKELVKDNQNGQYYIVNKIKHTASYTASGKAWLKAKLSDSLLFTDDKSEENKTIAKFDLELSQEQKKSLEESVKLQLMYRKQIENVLDKLLLALTVYAEDVDYVVVERQKKKKVVIIDSNTGRLKEKSRWEYGLHEAIEAKEELEVGSWGQQDAIISIKNYLKKYAKIAGMTGTAMACSKELRDVYSLSVLKIPTHRPILRKNLPLRVFRNRASLDEAVIDKAARLQKEGRPVLVCTATIKRSISLAKKFGEKGIKVQILNGKTLQEEASLVARAGKCACITISTSVAGRGTDIKPEEEALKKGGLAVIGVELAHSNRIDQQMAGRSGRQGNPGSSQFFVSLDDDILAYLSEEDKKTLGKKVLAFGEDENEIASEEVCRFFYLAQKNCVLEEVESRKMSNLRDDSIDSIRNSMYGMKDRILKSTSEADSVLKELFDKSDEFFWKEHKAHLKKVLEVAMPIIRNIQENTYLIDEYQRLPLSDGNQVYSVPFDLNSALESNGVSFYAAIEKYVLVDVINKWWIEYINKIDIEKLNPSDLQDIFLDIKKHMLVDIEDKLTKLYIPVNSLKKVKEVTCKQPITNPLTKYFSATHKKVGLLDLCPCGSGKFFYQCHGKIQIK